MINFKKIDNDFLNILRKYNLSDNFIKCKSDDRVHMYRSFEDFNVLKTSLYTFLTDKSFSFHLLVDSLGEIDDYKKLAVITVVNDLNTKFSSSPLKVFLDEDNNVVIQSHVFFCDYSCFSDYMFIKNYAFSKECIKEVLALLIPILVDLK